MRRQHHSSAALAAVRRDERKLTEAPATCSIRGTCPSPGGQKGDPAIHHLEAGATVRHTRYRIRVGRSPGRSYHAAHLIGCPPSLAGGGRTAPSLAAAPSKCPSGRQQHRRWLANPGRGASQSAYTARGPLPVRADGAGAPSRAARGGAAIPAACAGPCPFSEWETRIPTP